jgi:hypothetical protein
MNWNPRFVAYAKSNGNTPERQLEVDKEAWPGGCMVGFTSWISQKIKEFLKVEPTACCERCCSNHPKFDKFLNKT